MARREAAGRRVHDRDALAHHLYNFGFSDPPTVAHIHGNWTTVAERGEEVEKCGIVGCYARRCDVDEYTPR